jgi:hypothetical protein
MDQPTIYSETVRERVEGVWRLAFGVWRLAFGVRRSARRRAGVWAKRLKTGAADLQKEQYCRRAEFFALPTHRPPKL